MKQYDEAVGKFYKTQTINSLPLASWDLYATYFKAVCGNFKDIVSLQDIARKNRWGHSSEFETALIKRQSVIVVTDVNLRIVHATNNIIAMSGYQPQEVIGCLPKVFQGPETCEKTRKRIRKAVQKRLPFEEILLNYRKDGSVYNCWIKGEPVHDTNGKLVNFIAYEKEVA